MTRPEQYYLKELKRIFGTNFQSSEFEAVFLSYFQTTSGITAATTAGIYAFYLANTTLGDHNIDLDAAALWAGKQVIVKADALTDSNVVNIIPDGSETIDGESSFIINTQKGAVTLYSDGTNIHVVSFI